jgi:hypothetical protein
VAKKQRCPACGAKNAIDLRRCRVCAALINVEVAEDRRGLALGPDEVGTNPPPAPPPAPAPATASAPAPAPPAVGDGEGAGDGIVFDVAPRNPEVAPPPAPAAEDYEPFDPNALEIDPPR